VIRRWTRRRPKREGRIKAERQQADLTSTGLATAGSVAVDDLTGIDDPGLSHVKRLRAELEAMGILRWNGEYRDGQKVYVVVPDDEMTPEARQCLARLMAEGTSGGEEPSA